MRANKNHAFLLFIALSFLSSGWVFRLYVMENIHYYEAAFDTTEWSSSPLVLLHDDCKVDNSTAIEKRASTFETYVIAMELDKFEAFQVRNNHSGLSTPNWQPGVDGWNQATIDRWARMIRQPSVNLSSFQDTKDDRDKYNSPHAIGCYLAHWHLMRNLASRPPALRPDLYFVFENDAACIPKITEQVVKVTQSLPPDWDILFIGGKPFTYFYNASRFNDSKTDTLRRDICRGAFGYGSSPLAPDGSRKLSTTQPYWKCRSLSNTHSYVLNPQRVDRLLKVVKPRYYRPIDIVLQNAMQNDEMNVYMTTRAFCHQAHAPLRHPMTWWGFYGFNLPRDKATSNYTTVHPGLSGKYIWGRMVIPECNSTYY